MQAATQSSIDGAMIIVETISNITESIGIVDSALVEQAAVTQEMVRSITTVADEASRISDNILAVQADAEQTGATAEEVSKSALKLNEQAQILKRKVEEFISMVRKD